MRALGWTILTLVFVDELLAMAAYGVWGHHVGGWLPALVLPLAAMFLWGRFASPKAPHGGAVVRPLVKVLVFASASLALWHAGHPGWAAALLGLSVAVNAVAQLGFVRALVADHVASAPLAVRDARGLGADGRGRYRPERDSATPGAPEELTDPAWLPAAAVASP